MKTAVISGVGPVAGLGAQLCIRFANEGLHILLAGRTQEKLDAVVEVIKSHGGSAEAIVADATDEAATVDLFARAGDDLALAIYNTGNNTPGRIIEMDAEFFERSWRVCCFGGFLFGLIVAVGRGRFALPTGLETVLLVGFLGGFTTYSSFAFQSVALLEQGRMLAATANMIGTTIAALLAVVAGLQLGRLAG